MLKKLLSIALLLTLVTISTSFSADRATRKEARTEVRKGKRDLRKEVRDGKITRADARKELRDARKDARANRRK